MIRHIFKSTRIREFSRLPTYYINTACSGFWVGAMIRVIVLLRNKYSARSLVSLSLFFSSSDSL